MPEGEVFTVSGIIADGDATCQSANDIRIWYFIICACWGHDVPPPKSVLTKARHISISERCDSMNLVEIEIVQIASIIVAGLAM